jgi:hypothetical protein
MASEGFDFGGRSCVDHPGTNEYRVVNRDEGIGAAFTMKAVDYQNEVTDHERTDINE